MIPSSTFSEKKCRAKVVAEEASSRINREGSAAEFTRMRSDYEQHTILDRDVLRKSRSAIDGRCVFQPHVDGERFNMNVA